MPYCSECGGEFLPGVDICPDCDLALVDAMPPANPDADPEGNMVEICRVAGDVEALVIRGLLESEGITCSLSSDIPHTIVPLDVDGLGTVRISVLDEDADRAAKLIAEH